VKNENTWENDEERWHAFVILYNYPQKCSPRKPECARAAFAAFPGIARVSPREPQTRRSAPGRGYKMLIITILAILWERSIEFGSCLDVDVALCGSFFSSSYVLTVWSLQNRIAEKNYYEVFTAKPLMGLAPSGAPERRKLASKKKTAHMPPTL
jgi:hypothetical protein